MKITFRTAQLMGYTLVVALMGAFTIYAGFSFISETVVKEAKLRVEMDLNSAWHSYDDEKALIEMAVSMATQHESLRGVLRGRTDITDMIPQMRVLADKYGLHFLTLLDKDGVVLARLDESGDLGHPVRRDPVIDRALKGTATKGTALVSHSDLLRESAELARTAYIPLVPTERARPTERLVEDRSMVVEAAVPILTAGDSVLGVFYGGKLLNRKFRLVDRVRNAVFGDNVYRGKPLGTVTIFLQDVRIATNVIKADSTRAIGTRVSDEVYAKVLERGERFADRAFVVNDWYLSAYDPIKDPNGEIIGILYVGLLEKKYLDYKSSLVMRFLEITFLALLLSVVLCFFLSATIRRPVLRLVEATRRLSTGELAARVSGTSTIREMKELAESFNSMAQSLEIRSNQLNEASQALKQALARADEKNRAYLEMLGFVTHELKSPLASIVFTIESLRERILGPVNEDQESILKAASNSAYYLNATIANYLNLSRIEEGELSLKLKTVKVREAIVEPVIQRLSEMAADNRMLVICDISADLEATCDRDLLTSVFQNLLSNAIKYGKEGGEIKISREQDAPDELLKFSVYNEGLGFTEEENRQLFTKFSRFSVESHETKPGTGLGLFVTQKIIEKHGGRIWAESEPGQWANFIFTVPRHTRPPGESLDRP